MTESTLLPGPGQIFFPRKINMGTSKLWPPKGESGILGRGFTRGPVHFVHGSRYDYQIRSDHSPGIYWAHPHHHGSTVGGVGRIAMDVDPRLPMGVRTCSIFLLNSFLIELYTGTDLQTYLHVFSCTRHFC